MRAFLSRLRIEDAIVGDDADRITPDARKTGHQRRSIARFEFIELACIDDAGDHLAHVVRLANVGVDDAIKLIGGIARPCRRRKIQLDALGSIQVSYDAPRDGECMIVILREMVCDAGDARMNVGAAQFLR